MSVIKRARVVTKSNEVRAKIVPSDYNKDGVKRITIYIGKDIYNNFFTYSERQKTTRVKLDIKEDGNLILRKVKDSREGVKLCVQGRGTFGTHKVLTKLPANFDASALPRTNHALNFRFAHEFGVKSLELMPPVMKEKHSSKDMIINKKSLAPKQYEIRLKVNTYNKTFRLYFTKLVYDRFIVKDGEIGRVAFDFPEDPSAKHFFLRRVSALSSKGKPLGHKIIKNSHSNSYTVMGKIPEYFDASFINPVNHPVNYTHNLGTVDFPAVIKIEPQYNDIKVSIAGREIIPSDDVGIKQLNKQQLDQLNKTMEEFTMATNTEELKKRINELEQQLEVNQEAMYERLIEKFSNLNHEVVKNVLEGELADIRHAINTKNNDIDEKLIAKANDMFQGILDNILQKELESIREQIRGNEKDIKDILKEMARFNANDSKIDNDSKIRTLLHEIEYLMRTNKFPSAAHDEHKSCLSRLFGK